MSKVITSPSKRWPGTVTIADPLNMGHVDLIERALEWPDGMQDGKPVLYTVMDKPAIPALLACVEKWELANFPSPPTVETFPFSPRRESHDLIAWLFEEIRRIYTGEEIVPNE